MLLTVYNTYSVFNDNFASMKKQICRLLALGLITLNAFSAVAQDVAESEFQITKEPKPFTVLLDGSALLLSGFGAKALYSTQDTMAFGAIASYSRLKSDDKENNTTLYYRNDYKHTKTQVGAIAEFYILNQSRKGGMYITLGATSAYVKTEVDSELFGANNSESSRIGAIGAVGWHYTERLTDKANVAFQLGFGYGNGGAIQWNYAGTKTEIKDSVLLDIKAGLQF